MANESLIAEKQKARIAKDVARQEKELANAAKKRVQMQMASDRIERRQMLEKARESREASKESRNRVQEFKQTIIAARAGGMMIERLAVALYDAASAHKRMNLDAKIVANTMGGTTAQAKEMLQTFDTMDARVGLPEGFSQQNFARLQQNLGATQDQARAVTDKFRQLAQEGNMKGGAQAAAAYADGVLSINEAFMKNKNIIIQGREAIMSYMGNNIHATEAVIVAMKELGVVTLNSKNANDVFQRAYSDNARVRLADEAAEDKALRNLKGVVGSMWDVAVKGASDAVVHYDAWLEVLNIATVQNKTSAEVMAAHWDNVMSGAKDLTSLMTKTLEETAQKMPEGGEKVAMAIVAGFNRKLPNEMKKSFHNASFLALQAMQETLGIHSPSTEAAWMGKMIVAGLDKEIKVGVEDIGSRMSGIIPRASGGTTSNTSTSLTQHINVNANTQVNEAASGAEIGETFTASLDQSLSHVFRRAALAMGVS